MTYVDRILELLASSPGPACDDCLSVKTGIPWRQQVYQIAEALLAERRIQRGLGGSCTYCGRPKKLNAALSTSPDVLRQTFESTDRPKAPSAQVEAGGDPNASWDWEGNVQAALRKHLEDEGWVIVEYSNTAAKQRGADLAATRNEEMLVVEVKGYPAKEYQDVRRRGETKRTSQSSLARQFYSHALLSAMTLLQQRPMSIVALCFPVQPTYLRLIDATIQSVQKLGVRIYLVGPDGSVATR